MRRCAVWIPSASVLLVALARSTLAQAQEAAPSPRYLEEIVVTAQKWEQSANTVGMSITALRAMSCWNAASDLSRTSHASCLV
jgi:outer membrane cobalamin receptor